MAVLAQRKGTRRMIILVRLDPGLMEMLSNPLLPCMDSTLGHQQGTLLPLAVSLTVLVSLAEWPGPSRCYLVVMEFQKEVKRSKSSTPGLTSM